jgi:hypothetical protein
MTKERLNDLATCSIEKDILTNVDLNIILRLCPVNHVYGRAEHYFVLYAALLI